MQSTAAGGGESSPSEPHVASGHDGHSLVPCPGCHMMRPVHIAFCPHCGLLLNGDLAVRLRRIDERLYELAPALSYSASAAQLHGGGQEHLMQRYRSLLVERANVLAALYALGTGAPIESATTAAASPEPAAGAAPPQPVGAGSASGEIAAPAEEPGPSWGSQPLGWIPAKPAGKETSPRVVQNTLLTLGGVLIGTAALAFTIFAWGQLSIATRGVILSILSLAVLGAPVWLNRRGLRATAETLVVIGFLLVALDAYAAWHAAPSDTLPHTINPFGYSALTAAVIAVVAVLYRLGFPLLAPRLIAVAAVHAIPPLLALGFSTTTLSLAVACLVVAAFDIGIIALEWAGRPVRYVCIGGAGVATILGYTTALTTVGIADSDAEASTVAVVAAGFAVLVGLSSFGARRSPVPQDGVWDGVSAALAPFLLWGAVIAVTIRLTTSVSSVVLSSAVIGLLAAAIAAALPTAQRVGATIGTGIILGLTGAPLTVWILLAAWAPVVDGEPQLPWDNPVVVGARMLTAAMAGCVAWAILQYRWRTSTPGLDVALGPALLAIAVFTTTIGPIASAPVPVLIALPLLGTIIMASLGMLDTKLPVTGTFAAALLLTVNAFTRGLVSPSAAIGALVVIVVMYVAIAALSPSKVIEVAATVVAGAALLGLSGAITQALDGNEHDAAYLLLVGVALLTGVSLALFGKVRSVAVACQILAGSGLFVAVLLTTNSAFHCAVVLSTGTTLIAALAILPAQRSAIWWALAMAPLAIALWLRVADVRTVETYTIPLALAALIGGTFAHHRKPDRSSWATFGPALIVGMGPTLAITLFGSPDVIRALVLSVAALTITAVGAFTQRQAPFVLGAIAVAAVAIRMVAPLVPRFTDDLPVWIPLAGAGLVLLAVGASYERGRRDVRRLVGAIRRMD